MFKMNNKRTTAFISYRNYSDNLHAFTPIEKVVILEDWLIKKGMCDRCDFIVPDRVFTSETLCTPYGMATFLNDMYIRFDGIKKFVILNEDYMIRDDGNDNGMLTSIWTEAECYMWSYYDRKMWFGPGKGKDQEYQVAEVVNNDTRKFPSFTLMSAPLLNLDDRARILLRRVSLDFAVDSDNSRLFCSKNGHSYVHTCNDCGRVMLLTRSFVASKSRYYCEGKDCDNYTDFDCPGKMVIARQHSPRRLIANSISILDIIEILYVGDPMSIFLAKDVRFGMR